MENNNFDVWEDIFQRKEWGKYPSIPLIKFVARNFYSSPDRSEVKLLEIGSGPGANLWYMAREGFTVYGIEGSQTACNNATKRLNNEGLGDRIGKIIAGDYHEKLNDFEDGYFDAIIDVESLYCNVWDKSKEIVKLAFDKLKPGGKMFSQTFADGTWGLEGEELDYHSLIPDTGVLEGTGQGRYTTKEDIEKLYKLSNNEIYNIERLDLHLANNESIKEWIIEIKKV